jgi:hypothetical protein
VKTTRFTESRNGGNNHKRPRIMSVRSKGRIGGNVVDFNANQSSTEASSAVAPHSSLANEMKSKNRQSNKIAQNAEGDKEN